MKGGMAIKKDLFTPAIHQKLLSIADTDRPFSASLRVDSKRYYWWFLEYGTARYFQAPSADPMHLERPARVAKFSHHGRKPYPITARGGKYQAYLVTRTPGAFVKDGIRRRRKLRFPNSGSKKVAGWNANNPKSSPYVFRDIAMHKGIHAIGRGKGFIRIAIKHMQNRVMQRAKQMAKEYGDEILSRHDVAEMLNTELAFMLMEIEGKVRRQAHYNDRFNGFDAPNDPYNPDDEVDPGSLKDAFDVTQVR